jgi:hypothetical protein
MLKTLYQIFYLIDPSAKAIEEAKKTYNNFNNVKLFNIAITDDQNQNELELFFPCGDKISEHTLIF